MKIKVLGTGCKGCKKMYEYVERSVQELGIDARVEYITDIQKITELGIFSTPALVIDNKCVSSGSVLKINEIKKFLQN